MRLLLHTALFATATVAGMKLAAGGGANPGALFLVKLTLKAISEDLAVSKRQGKNFAMNYKQLQGAADALNCLHDSSLNPEMKKQKDMLLNDVIEGEPVAVVT